jgi:hypothetical protein
MRYEQVTQGHDSNNVTASRNQDAERGVGRAWRHEPDMLPKIPVAVSTQRPGMSAIRKAHASRAWEEKKGVLGKAGALSVAVRSGNVDPRGIGVNKSNWGIAGEGDAPAVAATAPAQRNLYLIGGLAALAACFLLFKKG